MEKLNERQKEVVTTIDSPLLVIAGPGSGKTKTLVERVSYLLNEKNIMPQHILVVTFMEKAARELITRISNKISENIDISAMYIGTIHSICLRIIDENIEYSRLKKNYKILDDLEQRFFIYTQIKKFDNLEGSTDFFYDLQKTKAWDKAGELQKWIDRINEEGIENLLVDKNRNINFLKNAHKKYIELLFEENFIDFSNIQFECYRILNENPEVLTMVQDKINYIMIDEYQDTNHIQEKLFFLITGEKNNICVVGDDDQSIYRFRGATVSNILKFEKNFKNNNCKKIELNINYRSNQDIIDFCNKWNLSLNWDGWRYEKNIVSGRERRNNTLGVIKISVNSTEREWQNRLLKFLKYLKTSKKIKDYNQVAFLFKSVRNKRVLRLINYLEKNEIKVYSPRSNMLFEREEIKFIIGLFLCLFVNNKEYLYIEYYNICYRLATSKIQEDKELIDYIKNIRKSQRENNVSLDNFLKLFYNFFKFKSFIEYLNFDEDDILENRKTYNLAIFSEILKKFDNLCGVEKINNENINNLIDYLFDKHLMFLKNKISEYEETKENTPKNALSFLTIHQAKGLEFPLTIVDSLESYPDYTPNEAQEKLEFDILKEYEPKERIKEFDFWRMYYTGFSRAKNLLVLTCVENSKYNVPSKVFNNVYKDLKDARSDDFDLTELKFDEANTINIKDIFSITSHIETYYSCPRIYKILKKYKFSEGLSQKEFYGEFIHTTLEEINRISFRKISLDENAIKEIYKNNYKYIYKKYKISLGKDKLLEGLNNILYYFNKYKSIVESIKDIEIKVSFIEKDYIMEGIADLVIDNNGSLEIIDFKTGKNLENKNNYKRQLSIYSYLLEKKYNKKISKGKIFYINEESDKKLFEFEITEEEIQKSIEFFNNIIFDIKNKNFSTGYLDKNTCENCILKNYCEFFYNLQV